MEELGVVSEPSSPTVTPDVGAEVPVLDSNTPEINQEPIVKVEQATGVPASDPQVSDTAQKPTEDSIGFRELRANRDEILHGKQALEEKLAPLGGASILDDPAFPKVVSNLLDINVTPDTVWNSIREFSPYHANAMQSHAAWEYLNNPASAAVITGELFGEGVTPDLLQKLVKGYKDGTFDPDDTDGLYDVPDEVKTRLQQSDLRIKELETATAKQRQAEETQAAQAREQQLQTQMDAYAAPVIGVVQDLQKQLGCVPDANDSEQVARIKNAVGRMFLDNTLAAIDGDPTITRYRQGFENMTRGGFNDRANVLYGGPSQLEARKIATANAQIASELLGLALEGLRAKAQTAQTARPEIVGVSAPSVSPNNNGNSISDEIMETYLRMERQQAQHLTG